MALAGHYWTLASQFMLNESAPPAADWSVSVPDERWGKVRLTGRLRHEPDEPGCRRLALIVHGISGCAEVTPCLKAAAAAREAGWSSLRLNLRGCDRLGDDFYHAGLSSDLAAALASPATVGYDQVAVVGFSMGGHLGIHLAASDPDPRLVGVVAVCPPLDLVISSRFADGPARWPYRQYVLRGLREIYRPVAKRREVPVSFEEARRISTFHAWDHRIVAARWGFADAIDYYRRAGVAGRLERLAVPTLVVASTADPVVPPEAIDVPPPGWRKGRGLWTGDGPLSIRWTERGGHVFFPGDLDLGLPGELGLEGQTFGWLEERSAG